MHSFITRVACSLAFVIATAGCGDIFLGAHDGENVVPPKDTDKAPADAGIFLRPPSGSGTWTLVPANQVLPGTTGGSVSSFTYSDLNAIWGSGASDIWVVGGTLPGNAVTIDPDGGSDAGFGGGSFASSEGVAARWQGQSWSLVRAGWNKNQQGELQGVWGSAASDVFIVGDYPYASRWDGAKWSDPSGNNFLSTRAVWGSSANDVWLLGGSVARWNGTTLETGAGEIGNVVFAAWGTGASDVWAVGQSGIVAHYDGAAWTDMPSLAKVNLRGVWGSGADDVWAIGDHGALLHYSGNAWVSASSGTTKDLRGIWGFAANDVWVAGQDGTLLHFDGTSWSAKTSGTTRDLNALWGATTSDVWAVGEAGTILHYQ